MLHNSTHKDQIIKQSQGTALPPLPAHKFQQLCRAQSKFHIQPFLAFHFLVREKEKSSSFYSFTANSAAGGHVKNSVPKAVDIFLLLAFLGHRPRQQRFFGKAEKMMRKRRRRKCQCQWSNAANGRAGNWPQLSAAKKLFGGAVGKERRPR